MDEGKKNIYGTSEYFEDRWQRLSNPDDPYDMRSYRDERRQMLFQMGSKKPPHVRPRVFSS